ncbi:hypothetical protein Tco_0257975, partial [Tanacetum coccineum]
RFSRRDHEGVLDGPTTDYRGDLNGDIRRRRDTRVSMEEGRDCHAENFVEEPEWGRNRGVQNESCIGCYYTSRGHICQRRRLYVEQPCTYHQRCSERDLRCGYWDIEDSYGSYEILVA